VESVKAASSVYAPVDFTVKQVNTILKDDCALVNRSAEEDGWMIKVTVKSPEQIESLLDEDAYTKHTDATKH